MLVLLTPDFDGSPSSYQRLAELKGLVVRRMSLSPGASHRIEKKDEF